MLGTTRARLAYALLAVACACGTTVASPGDPDAEAPAADAGADADADAGAGADADADANAAADADLPTLPATLTLGAADRILLLGTVVTPDVTFDGQVLVEGSLITCVAPGAACAADAGAGATVIDTKGVIAPGLIDTHNHILFDIFDEDDWKPTKLYDNHEQWPNELRYQAMLDVKQCLANDSQGKPVWCAQTNYGSAAGSLRCEMDKWGELKGMIAGTTSIVGLPGTSAGCFSSLSRTIDAPQNDLGQDKIQTSALFPPSKAAADGVCANFADTTTDAYLIHVGEGVDQGSRDEFAQMGAVSTVPECLYAPQTTITHGTAFTATEFTKMAQTGMKLTWSPASNVALYGTTTNIPAARAANVLIALAPDWSMGGSQNLLDEMRFADAWDDKHFGNVLGAKDLVAMTTKNAASALALDAKIGSLAVGKVADLVVVSPKRADPYASLVAATPRDVRITMVDGKILYGDAQLQAAAPQAPGCEAITICTAPKFLCVAETTTTNKLDQTHAQIKAALEAALVLADSLTPADGWNFAPLTPLVKCD
jgi:5-methylthioadenosine/S-adenosylhomocysteine deaminase